MNEKGYQPSQAFVSVFTSTTYSLSNNHPHLLKVSTTRVRARNNIIHRRHRINHVRRIQPVLSATPPPPESSSSSSSSPSPQTKQDEQSSSSIPTPKPLPSSTQKEDIRNDIIATIGWICLALGTAGGIAKWKGAEAGLQFLTAYIVEYSLSVDNLFVFLLIFSYFQVPRDAQTRVLGYGIAGAVLFRGIMIVTGTALTHQFRGVTLGFAAILLLSAWKIVFSGEADEDDDVSQSAVVQFASKLLPFSDEYDGNKFFTTPTSASTGDNTQNERKWLATPLMLVLLSIEFSDVVFAFDSVPAVLGISDDTLVIYMSNILAIAGLRNLFFLLADSIQGLRFLPQSLAVVLGFVGAKMAASVFGYEVSILSSLSVIVLALSSGVALSLLFPEAEPTGS